MTEQRRARFLELVSDQARALASVATAYGRTAADREELVQEMHAQLWAAFPRYDEGRPFGTWAYRVMLNVAISHARARWAKADRTEPLVEQLEPAVTPDTDAPGQLAALRSAIDALDPLNRALVLLYLDDRSHRETAEILGLSEANVATRLSRIKQQLKQHLSGEDPHGAR